jgi:hypothetical protein
MLPQQRAREQARSDRFLADSRREQLAAGHHTVRPGRDPADSPGHWFTLVVHNNS